MGKPYLIKTLIIGILLINTFCFAQDLSGINVFEDRIFSKDIHSVQIYYDDHSPQRVLRPAAAYIGHSDSITLEFDELKDEAEYYYYKVIHCNSDWTKSDLAEAEYLSEYNEFLINRYDFSFNTQTNFTHYKLNMPQVRLSGNYVVIVYPSENKDDIKLMMRFMVTENLVGIQEHFRVSELVGMRDSHQQVGFELFYDKFKTTVPQQEFSVCIRQNQRWDNAKYNLKPLYMDDSRKQLDFRYFDENTNFPAWNEFRNFAFRNQNFADANVANLDLENRMVNVEKLTPRGNRAFVNLIDANGRFIIDNNIGDPELSSDYFTVNIFFPSDKLEGDYYVAGQLNNWELNERNRFEYIEEDGIYSAQIKLKMGYYDYMIQYVPSVQNDYPEWVYEGSFFETQNEYEIIVYFRPIGGRYDRIVAYLRRPFFER